MSQETDAVLSENLCQRLEKAAHSLAGVKNIDTTIGIDLHLAALTIRKLRTANAPAHSAPDLIWYAESPEIPIESLEKFQQDYIEFPEGERFVTRDFMTAWSGPDYYVLFSKSGAAPLIFQSAFDREKHMNAITAPNDDDGK